MPDQKNIHQLENAQTVVLQLIDSLAAGGAEMMAVNIANALAARGIQSHLCVTRMEGDLKNKINANVSYLFLNKKGNLDVKALLKLKNYIQKNKIQIVHAHSSSFFYAGLLKLRLPSLKLFWHDHYGKSEQIENRKVPFLAFFSRFFTGIISVNSILKNWAKQYLHCKNVTYLANFAALDIQESVTLLKGNSGKRMICLAGYRPQKDHLNLLQAFQKIVETHPDWSLHLVGKGYQDDYHRKIDAFIIQNQLESHVFQYGVKTDIAHILSQCNIGILSSESEGLPVSLLEYGLAGLAVIVTDVGECKSVLEQGKWGAIVPARDFNALADGLEKMLQNEEERINFAKGFQQHVQTQYGEESFVQILLKLYNPIV